ncbi:MAG TPA: lysophospholipid acyltransferase family protein [Phycisphaerales bacterium]|nr:lysophospholipid acyltransferase family protein [Phycisphaerales bacterium]HRQ75930.1 lysophospholipid acyltransferase family protein [Phycisphaerales bacterium]
MREFQTSRRQPGRSAFGVLFWWTFIARIVHLFFMVFYGIKCRGKENVPQTGAHIYVANHQSHYDPPIVGVLVRDRPFSSLARASLFHNPVFGWLIRSLGAVPIEQGRGDAGAIRTAIQELEAGRCVLIFPEGSRSPDGLIHPFQRGVLLLLKKAQVPVVPVAIEGAFDVWPAHQKKPRLSGRLAVRAASPIPYEDLMKDGADAALDRLRSEIDAMRLELREELRASSGGRFPPPGTADGPSRTVGLSD